MIPLVQTFHQKPHSCFVTEEVHGRKLTIQFDTCQQALDHAHKSSDVVQVHIRSELPLPYCETCGENKPKGTPIFAADTREWYKPEFKAWLMGDATWWMCPDCEPIIKIQCLQKDRP